MTTQIREATSDIVAEYNKFPDSGSNYEKINDDDDDTYVFKSEDTDCRDMYGFSAFTVPQGYSITKVTVYNRCMRSSGAPTEGESVYIGTTQYLGDQHAITGSLVTYSKDWTTNPATTNAWTVSEVNAIAGFGHTHITGDAGNSRCAKCYIEVTYELNLFPFPCRLA